MMYRGVVPDHEMGGYMSTRTIQHMDDDGASSSAGGSGKDKGRGSYKCGRVSVFVRLAVTERQTCLDYALLTLSLNIYDCD